MDEYVFRGIEEPGLSCYCCCGFCAGFSTVYSVYSFSSQLYTKLTFSHPPWLLGDIETLTREREKEKKSYKDRETVYVREKSVTKKQKDKGRHTKTNRYIERDIQ